MAKFKAGNYHKVGISGSHIKVFLGILIIAAAIVGLYFWETVGEENLMYDSVVTISENVPIHKVITKDMLATIKVPKDLIVKGAIKDYRFLIGKETQVALPKGSQLVKEFFEEDSFSLQNNEFIFAVPQSWLISFPQTLRRGDDVYFSPIQEKSEYDDEEGLVVDMNVIPPDKCVSATVYYVKDATNKEITDTSKEPRLDGSANVATIEVIIDKADYVKLGKQYLDGKKFVVLYR